MNEGQTFWTLLYRLEILVTAQVVGGLDDFILAAYAYAKGKSVELDSAIQEWSDEYFISPAADINADPGGEIDTKYIVHSIFMGRLFSLGKGYTWSAWDKLQDGLGLQGPPYTDSMRIASRAQLLSGGQRIRKWCGGGGLEGDPKPYVGYMLYKAEKSEGKQKFAGVLSALVREIHQAESEWAKAVLTATIEHFKAGMRDLTSKEVYEVIFKKTKPGTASGDEPSGEGANIDGGGDRVGDAAAPQSPT